MKWRLSDIIGTDWGKGTKQKSTSNNPLFKLFLSVYFERVKFRGQGDRITKWVVGDWGSIVKKLLWILSDDFLQFISNFNHFLKKQSA